MGDQSVISVSGSSALVGGSVFAPGHLGALTRFVPVDLVDAVVEESGARQRRLRRLPSRVGVYFLLALALFPSVGYARVWDKLTACLRATLPGRPSEKALRDLRRRLGPAPLKALFEVLAGPLAQPCTTGVCYRRWRTVAFDGCSSIKVPDQERNRSWLGRVPNRYGWAGYPVVQVMTLCETGTRGLLGAVFGPRSHHETFYARKLLSLLTPQMLLLADRAFDTDDFLAAVAATRAQFLVRLASRRRPAVLAVLPDGSYLTRLGTLQVRIIDADLVMITSDGSRLADHYRLATSLLDHRRHPADALVGLYHERWEIESAYYALRHTLQDGHVLRSADPIGLEQELWALLTLYQALRAAMVEAVESVPGTDPDRASFTIALETARNLTVTGPSTADTTGPGVGLIGQAVLTGLLPARRRRTSSRKVKAPVSRYAAHQHDKRPLASQNITALTVEIHDPAATPPSLPALGDGRRAKPGPGRPGDGVRNRTLQLLRSQPDRSWHLREIAAALGYTNHKSLATQLGKSAAEGLLHKISKGVYTLTPPTQPT